MGSLLMAREWLTLKLFCGVRVLLCRLIQMFAFGALRLIVRIKTEISF